MGTQFGRYRQKNKIPVSMFMFFLRKKAIRISSYYRMVSTYLFSSHGVKGYRKRIHTIHSHKNENHQFIWQLIEIDIKVPRWRRY